MKNQDFAQRVIEVVKLVPYGRVTSYGLIANYIGTGGSARTVGWVLGKSIEGREHAPAHRVVNSVGLLSGAHAFPKEDGMEKRLAKEGITVEKNKVVNFKTLIWDPSSEL